MANWYDFMVGVDLINRIEGIVSSFLYADWKGATQANGVAGVANELLRTAVGANRHKFWVARDADWSGADIEKFLRKYGVVIWDRGFVGDEYFFCVKERQANWAEYLLQRRGIPVYSDAFNPLNAEYGRRHAPGDAPPAWVDKGSRPIDEARPALKVTSWNGQDTV